MARHLDADRDHALASQGHRCGPCSLIRGAVVERIAGIREPPSLSPRAPPLHAASGAAIERGAHHAKVFHDMRAKRSRGVMLTPF